MHQMKEQGKNLEDRTNVEEISSLPDNDDGKDDPNPQKQNGCTDKDNDDTE